MTGRYCYTAKSLPGLQELTEFSEEMSETDPIELAERSPDTITGSFPNFVTDAKAPTSAQSLPPVDKGKDAWLFLFAATVCEMLVWGVSRLVISTSTFDFR